MANEVTANGNACAPYATHAMEIHLATLRQSCIYGIQSNGHIRRGRNTKIRKRKTQVANFQSKLPSCSHQEGGIRGAFIFMSQVDESIEAGEEEGSEASTAFGQPLPKSGIFSRQELPRKHPIGFRNKLIAHGKLK